MFKDPFDPNALLGRRCSCGGSHSAAEHARLTAQPVPAGEDPIKAALEWDHTEAGAFVPAPGAFSFGLVQARSN